MRDPPPLRGHAQTPLGVEPRLAAEGHAPAGGLARDPRWSPSKVLFPDPEGPERIVNPGGASKATSSVNGSEVVSRPGRAESDADVERRSTFFSGHGRALASLLTA